MSIPQVATPDVREEALSAHDEVLILASDGLWDVLTNQDAVNLIKDIPVRAAVPPRCPWDTSDHHLRGPCLRCC